jgi:hypothetical protein
MTEQDKIKSMITYILLKGTYGTLQEEVDDLIDFSGMTESICRIILRGLEAEKKIKLKSTESVFDKIKLQQQIYNIEMAEHQKKMDEYRIKMEIEKLKVYDV